MKYYLIAGEASGDLHASNLMKGLKKFDKNAQFRFFGGDKMAAVGGHIVKHYRSMAFMGLVDVILNIRTISANIELCKKDIRGWKPDLVILVDYAGFNLKIAEFAHKEDYKVYYYISPKVWVWRQSRIEKLKAFTDKIFVIFPFEVDFLLRHGLEAEFYGNPLMDSLHSYRSEKPSAKNILEELGTGDKPVIALLAGSRIHEVKRCLPEMVRASRAFPEYRFVIAGVPSLDEEVYRKIIGNSGIRLIIDRTYDILSVAEAAVVTSGTATLETALFNVPQVVIYKTSPVNYHIGKFIVKIRFFSLVNLISGKETVKELLQFNLASGIIRELGLVLFDMDYRKEMLASYREIKDALGSHGTSERIAARITELNKIT